MAYTKSMTNGYLDDSYGYQQKPIPKVIMVDGEPATEIVVHRFRLGDVDDPDLYAAEPLWQWEQSDAGKWVMENAVEVPRWQRYIDYTSYHTQYAIIARLKSSAITYYLMRWGT